MALTDHERMSVVDTAWLRMDGPDNSMMIVGVTATATPVRFEDLRRVIRTRFLCFPRFRHRPVADALGASWVEDDNFDLDAHVIRTNLPAPAGRKELQDLAATLAGAPLDPRRPMWQVHFVPKYAGGSAWILRLHHCYADGIAMIRVLLSMTEQDSGPALAASSRRRKKPTVDVPKTGVSLGPLFDWVDQVSRPATDILESALAEGARLVEGGVHNFFHPQRTTARLAQAGRMTSEFARVLVLADDPPTPLRGTLSGQKAVAFAESLPLEDVKTIGSALGCTVNDVLMATLAGALGGYLREQDFDTDGLVVRAMVPINLRAAEEPLTLGNKFGLVFVDLPVGIANPLERLRATRDTMAALKASVQPPMTLAVLGLLGLLPAALQAPAIELFSRKGSLVASNVPGPQAPLNMCGQRISEMYFWVPQSGSMGVGASILTYAGRVFFGVIADSALMPQPDRVVARFAAEWEKLVLAASVGVLAGSD